MDANDFRDAIEQVPLFDMHTHLVDGRLAARGLHDILLYHMAVSDLYAAGCPSGERLAQFPGVPTDAEAEARILEALPWLEAVRNTSTSWGIRHILRELYGWTETIGRDNWRRLDSLIRERVDDRSWHREIFAQAGIAGVVTEHARRGAGLDDDFLRHSLEWGFFTRCQWGEHDTALYELERCWGEQPGPSAPIGAGGRPATRRVIRSLDDVHEALAWYVGQIPETVVSTATHLSTDIDYAPASPEAMAAALARRDSAGTRERDIYASYIQEAFLSALEKRFGAGLLYQFSLGAEPLPHETCSRLEQRTIAQLADMAARHPGLRFQCYLSSGHANQALCTLCRELPNLSLAGYWWHNFFPTLIRQVIGERLDMLPLNRQVGFFSDAYCAEWAFAKAHLVRVQLAQVLWERVGQGQFTAEEALGIARVLLHDTAEAMARPQG